MFSGDRKAYLLLLFVLGYSTILSQVLILREFLVAFGGNELIIGLFLAAWMIITAAGAFAGRFFAAKEAQPGKIMTTLYITGFVPLLLLCLIDLFRNSLFLPGIQPAILQIMISVVLLLSMYCLVAGFLFTRLSRLLRSISDDHALDEAYAFESLGSMTGGILFSFLLVFFFDNLEAACITALMAACAVAYAAWRTEKRQFSLPAIFLALTFAAGFFLLNGSLSIRQHLFPDQQIVAMQDTPYGNLTITTLAEQLNFYQNNTLLFSTHDQLASEEAVHYAMVQHPDPTEVLLISGGIAGLTEEILKYESVRLVDYIELDPAVFVLGKEHTTSLSSEKVIPHPMDARRFVRDSRKSYDVVIMNLPEPSTLELNRYFTLEFFREVKDILAADGILSFSLPSTVNYMNEPALRLNSSIYNTGKAVFRHVNIYPAGRNIFVATDAQLSYAITQLIEEKHIPTDFVNLYFVDDLLTEQRAAVILDQLSTAERVNEDFKPVALYGFLNYWLSQFHGNLNVLSVVVLILSLAAFGWFLSRHPAYPGMFTAGFSASTLQIILLISFQIVMGHVYQSLGIFIAVFMAGLAAGALVRQKLLPECTCTTYAVLQFILVAVCCMVPLLILLSRSMNGLSILVHLFFSSMIMSVSVVTGILFSASLQWAGSGIGSGIGPATRLSSIYATDMAGAALGAILTTLFMIPVAGILNTSFLCAILVLLSSFRTLLQGNNAQLQASQSTTC